MSCTAAVGKPAVTNATSTLPSFNALAASAKDRY